MRDVKFRALDATTCEWVYYGTAITGTVDHLQLRRDTESQYTELKDKNGTEIYEGDIALFDGENLKCIIETDGVWFENDNLTMRHDDFEKYGEAVKVIGNIHQNPELLP